MKYCEGAKAAEILFSLTGGREGRLMSYAPPVTIISPAKNIERYTFYEITYTDFGETKKTIFDSFLPSNNQIDFKNRLAWTYSYNGRWVNGEYIWTFEKISYPLLENNEIAYHLATSEMLVYKKLSWLEKNNVDFEQGYIPPVTFRNGLLIFDTEGVLYGYEVPEGFTPTWQVNCIGCNPGECAGSDGKGGVVCMDCADMNRNIQAIKRSLNR